MGDSAAYNESYARKAAAVQVAQLLPSGYDNFIIGGWSVGGLLVNNGSGLVCDKRPSKL